MARHRATPTAFPRKPTSPEIRAPLKVFSPISRTAELVRFSEMQHLADPELLAGLLRSLAAEAQPVFGGNGGVPAARSWSRWTAPCCLAAGLAVQAWALWQDQLYTYCIGQAATFLQHHLRRTPRLMRVEL